MLFLANVDYYERTYGNDDTESFNKIHIVEAKTEEEAEEKTNNYYEGRTSDYSTYYTVIGIEITEMIK